jgi:DNA-binding MarR family transcriptional regulator
MSTSPEIRTAIRVLEAFKDVDPDITLPSMLAFLYAAELDNRAMNQTSVDARLGMSMATTSRALSHWMDRKHTNKLGLRMIESIPDPEDRRYKRLILNSYGREFLEKVKAAAKTI